MCQIEERTYISANGARQVFEIPHPCKDSRHGRYCQRVEKKKTQYYSDPPSLGSLRDEIPSPASSNPPTPNDSSTVLLQERRPDRRPSSQDSSHRSSTRYIKPEIIIDFGSKKGREKKYKRSSLGAASVASSNEVHIDTPGSGASYSPIRTGFPEAPLPPAPTHGYTTVPAYPTSHHSHNRTSSYTSSTHEPSSYAPSEQPSPVQRQRSTRTRPVSIHNTLPPINTSVLATSPASSRVPESATYHTITATPRHVTFPTDYEDFVLPASSIDNAPEILGRDSSRERLRRENQEKAKKDREEADRKYAQKIADEDRRQAEIEMSRAKGRQELRSEAQWAEKEKDRANEREAYRRQKKEEERIAKEKQMQKDKAARAQSRQEKKESLAEEVEKRKKQAKEAEANRQRSKKDSRSSPHEARSSKRMSRNLSDEIAAREREILLAETQAQMERERLAAEQREHNERIAELQRQQQTSGYWDPRGRAAVEEEFPRARMERRPSVSTRRPSVSTRSELAGLRRNVSVHQPTPPPVISQPAPAISYNTRPPSSHRPTSSHYSSNPLSPTSAASLRQRGEQVIAQEQARAAAEQEARVRQAARGLRSATRDDDDENEADRAAGFGPRLGLGRRNTNSGKRRSGGL